MCIGDVLLNLVEHKLVPKHGILKAEEVSGLLNMYKINAKKLPRILSSDPIVEAVGAKAGDVIKVERESATAGSSAYYRIVVKG